MTALPTDNRWKTADVLPAFFTLVAGAIFGGSMIFITPPFDVPEEDQHFYRSYQVSQGIVFASKESDAAGNELVGGELPASLGEANQAAIGSPKNEHELRISAENLRNARLIPLEPERTEFYGFPVTVRYSPLTYLPAAAAIWAGRLAGRTALEELYLGRIGTLIGYLLLAAVAVWLMPVHKWTMTLVALMPMSIFLAASVTADSLSIAVTLLAIAMILRLVLRPELGKGDSHLLLEQPGGCCAQKVAVPFSQLGWLGAVLLAVALVKPGYVLIAPLFLLVPKEKFANARQCWWLRAAMIALPLAVSLLWVLSIRGLCVPLRPCVDVKGQAAWILGHPWSYMKWMDTRLNDYYLLGAIIGTLGWGTILLAPAVYWIYWIALVATAVLDGGRAEVRVPIFARMVSAEVYFLVMSAIATLTYLAWHAVGERLIHGVQPRYFVPVLPLLLLPLRGSAKLACSRFSRWLVPATAIAVVMIGVGATWQAMIARYYWR